METNDAKVPKMNIGVDTVRFGKVNNPNIRGNS